MPTVVSMAQAAPTAAVAAASVTMQPGEVRLVLLQGTNDAAMPKEAVSHTCPELLSGSVLLKAVPLLLLWLLLTGAQCRCRRGVSKCTLSSAARACWHVSAASKPLNGMLGTAMADVPCDTTAAVTAQLSALAVLRGVLQPAGEQLPAPTSCCGPSSPATACGDSA